MQTITFDHALFPKSLKNIASPPKTLFIEGNVECLSKPCLAIVGTRKPSHVAISITEKWSKILSDAGIVIASGFAVGIDAAAHRGALQGQAKTIAVLGCGLNIDYPKQHKNLRTSIIEQGGCIISEYPPDTPPHPKQFPHRNRIISGLSEGVLVIEAALRSGSLITARIAAEQGKEVMAVPGNILNAMTQGCHWLIRDGATLVSSIEEVAEGLKQNISTISHNKTAPYQHSLALSPNQANSQPSHRLPPGETSSTTSKHPILRHIYEFPTSIDEIVINSRLDFADVCSILIELEIAGHIEKISGGYRLL